MESINLADKLATFSDYWQPRVVGEFNGHDLKGTPNTGKSETAAPRRVL
jgi:hypothetical protein